MPSHSSTLFSLSCDEPQDRMGLFDWLVGGAFAFYVGATSAVCGASGPVRFLGGAARTFPAGGVAVAAEPKPWRAPALEAVITDRDLYREGKDTVRVLVFAPAEAGREAQVTLRLNNQPLAEVKVSLDANGLGLYELPDPPAGEYEAKLGQSVTRFTAASFKLAPLTASLADSAVTRDGKAERLRFSLRLDTYGAPFTGTLSLSVMDLSASPPKATAAATIAAINGGASGEVPLQGEGPFALQVQAADDAMKTATVPLPGSRKAERSLLTLSALGKRRRVASLLPFEGALSVRGVYVGDEDQPSTSAPVQLEQAGDHVTLRARADIDALCVALLSPSGVVAVEQTWRDLDAGATVTLPLDPDAPWALALVGALSLGRAWEGRAALIQPARGGVTLAAPSQCAPGERVTLTLTGDAGASAWVLVKDARLQVADTPLSAAAASLRRQVEAGLGLLSDQDVKRSLDALLPPPPPPMPPVFFGAPQPMRGGGGWEGGPVMFAAAAPVMAGAPMPPMTPPGAPMPAPAPAMKSGDTSRARVSAATRDDASEGSADAPAPPAARQRFPEVMLARLVTLDAEGRAEVAVQMGDAVGQVAVEVFCVRGLHWATAQAQVLVTRDLFGELVLPCFVRRGDFAEGRLFVQVAPSVGPVAVTVRRDGQPLALASDQGRAQASERLTLDPPGATVTFGAEAGAYVAEVAPLDPAASTPPDRAEGKVEEPGKLVWLQKALRMLLPGDEVRDDAPGVVQIVAVPSLDDTFKGMIGGLRSYAHCCCEQTSAVMLAAAAAYLTAPDDDTKRQAANHIRACVAREREMYLPGRGFKGWPESSPEVFCYSPGATLNLLQMDLLADLPLDRDLKAAVDDCLVMARDAARAHRIDTAPASPKSAREAYGRFTKFLDDRQRMAAFIRERIEPWEREMVAILKFDLPSLTTETYHRSPAMIRAETAFGAATLIGLGGAALTDGLRLANTVLSAVQENGSLYSTLDSVAAITLLTAMQRAGVTAHSGTPCLLNGQPATLDDALRAPQIHSLRATSSPLQVQVQRVVEEDYTAINQGVRATFTLSRAGKPLGPKPVARLGDALSLTITLTSGYEAGDLVHVFLPDALSWVLGGGQVKRFSLDLQGQASITVPLAATGLTLDAHGQPAPQHFAACVRNMYDERRGLGTDALSVTVTNDPPPPPEAPGLGERIVRGLKGLFGK